MPESPVMRAPSWLIAAILALLAGLMFMLGDGLIDDTRYGWRGAVLFAAAAFALVWIRLDMRKRELRRRAPPPRD